MPRFRAADGQAGTGGASRIQRGGIEGSPHAALDCTACHSDIKEVPHADKLACVDCGQCTLTSRASLPPAARQGRGAR
jgi:hypothetical protein